MNTLQALTRRSFVRSMLAIPAALALPTRADTRPMTVNEAIDALHRGVFRAQPQRY